MIISIKNIISISVLFLLFTSCEDTVTIDLPEVDDILVVDAWLNTNSTPQTIRITMTQNYFDSNPVLGVSGVIVELIPLNSNFRHSISFEDQGDGYYTWTPGGDSLGIEGYEYKLNISHENKIITSTATIHRSPEIREITQEFVDDSPFFDDGIFTDFYAKDFEGAGDCYWIKSYKNNRYLNDPQEINLAFDAGYTEGLEIDGILFIQPIRELINPVYADLDKSDDELNAPWHEGDTMRLEIHSLSYEAFKFMELTRDQLINGSNGIFAEPLVNSKGNIVYESSDEDVLGVFNIAKITSKVKIIE